MLSHPNIVSVYDVNSTDGVDTIVPRPKDLGGGVYGFVPHIGLSLTYDHRALDGGEATRFVKQIATEIENLEFEL